MIGVYALCGNVPCTCQSLSDLMPALVYTWSSTFEVIFTLGESTAMENEPCRSFLLAFSRYLASPWFPRYVCGCDVAVEQSTAAGANGNEIGAQASAI